MNDPNSHMPPSPPHLQVGGWNLWLLHGDRLYIRSPGCYEGGCFPLNTFEAACYGWNTLASGRVEDMGQAAELIAVYFAENF